MQSVNERIRDRVMARLGVTWNAFHQKYARRRKGFYTQRRIVWEAMSEHQPELARGMTWGEIGSVTGYDPSTVRLAVQGPRKLRPKRSVCELPRVEAPEVEPHGDLWAHPDATSAELHVRNNILSQLAITPHVFDRDEKGDLSRKSEDVENRVVVWKAMRGRGLSYPAIGRACGSPHTTIITALEPRTVRRKEAA